MSTIALVAGCGSADRIEVSGVVRDGRTGSPLAGARVTGADGAATHTDAEGRFTLAVVRGLRTQLRVSAEGHADAVQSFGADAFVVPATLAFELEPLVVHEDEAGIDPDAVVRWCRAGWIAERFSRGHAEAQHDGAAHDWAQDEGARRDAGWIEADAARDPRLAPCPMRADEVDTPLLGEEADVALEVADVEAPWLGAGAACVRCHRDETAGIQANVVVGGEHAGLGDSCLSCHASDGAFDPRACGRCHGQARGVGGDTTNRAWNLEVVVPGHVSYETAVSRARAVMSRRLAGHESLDAWIELLERDGSEGAHDPSRVRALAEAAAQ